MNNLGPQSTIFDGSQGQSLKDFNLENLDVYRIGSQIIEDPSIIELGPQIDTFFKVVHLGPQIDDTWSIPKKEVPNHLADFFGGNYFYDKKSSILILNYFKELIFSSTTNEEKIEKIKLILSSKNNSYDSSVIPLFNLSFYLLEHNIEGQEQIFHLIINILKDEMSKFPDANLICLGTLLTRDFSSTQRVLLLSAYMIDFYKDNLASNSNFSFKKSADDRLVALKINDQNLALVLPWEPNGYTEVLREITNDKDFFTENNTSHLVNLVSLIFKSNKMINFSSQQHLVGPLKHLSQGVPEMEALMSCENNFLRSLGLLNLVKEGVKGKTSIYFSQILELMPALLVDSTLGDLRIKLFHAFMAYSNSCFKAIPFFSYLCSSGENIFTTSRLSQCLEMSSFSSKALVTVKASETQARGEKNSLTAVTRLLDSMRPSPKAKEKILEYSIEVIEKQLFNFQKLLSVETKKEKILLEFSKILVFCQHVSVGSTLEKIIQDLSQNLEFEELNLFCQDLIENSLTFHSTLQAASILKILAEQKSTKYQALEDEFKKICAASRKSVRNDNFVIKLFAATLLLIEKISVPEHVTAGPDFEWMIFSCLEINETEKALEIYFGLEKNLAFNIDESKLLEANEDGKFSKGQSELYQAALTKAFSQNRINIEKAWGLLLRSPDLIMDSDYLIKCQKTMYKCAFNQRDFKKVSQLKLQIPAHKFEELSSFIPYYPGRDLANIYPRKKRKLAEFIQNFPRDATEPYINLVNTQRNTIGIPKEKGWHKYSEYSTFMGRNTEVLQIVEKNFPKMRIVSSFSNHSAFYVYKQPKITMIDCYTENNDLKDFESPALYYQYTRKIALLLHAKEVNFITQEKFDEYYGKLKGALSSNQTLKDKQITIRSICESNKQMKLKWDRIFNNGSFENNPLITRIICNCIAIKATKDSLLREMLKFLASEDVELGDITDDGVLGPLFTYQAKDPRYQQKSANFFGKCLMKVGKMLIKGKSVKPVTYKEIMHYITNNGLPLYTDDTEG